MSRKKKGTQTFIKAVSVSVIGATSSVALAAPTGGNVISGGITIAPMNNNELVITQALQKGIINWTDFSIDAGELVRFAQQAGNDSITLNRVLGSQVSNIQGALQANGNIFLINPNGIVFGAGSQVDVAGLLATTFDVTDASFLSGGQLEFSQVAGKDLASIANQGTITSGTGGFVYLVAPKVDNSGFVIANVGRVTMAAGDRFTVNLQGSNLINFSVTGDTLAAATGSDLEGVKNSGTVTAQTVILQGNSASGLMSSVVNNSGVVEATDLTIDAGDIVQNGTVKGVGTAAATTATLTAGKTISTGANSSTRATTVNLTVKDEGASIGSEEGAISLDADVLNASSQSGNVLVTDVNGGVALGEVKAGTPAAGGSVVITAQNGSITSADTSKANVTGYSAKLVADSAVGSDSTAVNTKVGVLSASTQNGGINVKNDGAVILGDVIAREQITVNGQTSSSAAIDNSGSITLSNTSVGSKNVKVQASEGVILTGTVSATNGLTVTSDTGSILAAQAGTSLVGRTVNLSAGGEIGDASQSLSTQSNTVNAAAGNGGVYLSESNGLTIGTLTAAGTDNNVVLNATQGNITVGSITAADAAVTLNAGNGSIFSASGSTTNVTAKDLTATAKSAIATSAKKLGTSVDTLTATTTAAQAGVYATNDKALQKLSVTTPNGETSVAFSGGALTYSRNTNGLALTRLQAMDVSFSNTAAGLKLNGIDAGSDKSVSLTAAGDITQGSGSVVAKDLTLDASGSIGALGTALQTQASDLTLTSRNGIANVQNTSADLALTATATSANGAVSVNQSGNLEVNSVNAKTAVNLTAGGAVTAAASAPGTVISAGSLTVSGASLGTASKALSSKVAGAVNLTATNGDVNVSNIGAITLLDVLASNGKIAFQNAGDTVVGQLQASGSIDFKVSGNVTDGNGSAANFITSGLSAAVKSFGTSGDAMEIQVDELVIDAANGGIYARQASGNLISLKQVTSGGTGSDIQIQADGSIKLGNVNAGGNNVKIAAGGSIEDGRTSTANANVVARSLDISAPNGIGQQGDLALDVSFLSAAGGSAGVTATNAGAVAVDASSLTGKGTSAINIVATAITILDNNGGTITMDGGSLVLKATSGNIVFLNQNDTIYLPGGGSITLIATSKASSEVPGYDGVIIAGNLKTDGGNITLQAQSNITIGMLDAGSTGNVTVASAGGVILDGNGTAQNIRGNTVSLTASTPSKYTAELTRDTAIAEYSARDAEAAAKLLQLNILIQQLKDYEALVTSATLQNSLAELTQRLSEAAANAQSTKVDVMSATADSLNTILNAATVVRNAAAVIAGAAQAVPFSGDAGADAAFAVVDLVMSAASLALDSYERYTLAPQQDLLVELNNTLDVANAAVYTAATNLATTTQIRDTTATSKATADLAVFKANTARDASLQVRKQAVAAYNLNQQIDSSADKPLGITANRLDINNGGVIDSSLYLNSTGSLGLGDITVASGQKIVAEATGNVGVVGSVNSDTSISLKAGQAILGQGGVLVTPDLKMVAGNGIGALTAVNTQTDRVAADAGNGGVAIVNANGGALLTIGTQGAVKGITGAGDISVTTDGSLKIDQLVKDSTHTHTVSLTSSNGAIVDGNTVDRNVQGGTLVAKATGAIDLDSEVDTLNAEVTNAGNITVREANAVTARNLKTASGNIDLKAGGAVVVGALDAGTGNVDLQADGAIDDDQDNSTLIVADTLNIHAAGSVGATGSNANRHLDTLVNSVNVTAAGEVNLAEVDDLNVGTLETDHGNVTVTTGGSLNVGSISTDTSGSDTVSLVAGNQITNAKTDGTSNIDAAALSLHAANGIGNAKALDVKVANLEAYTDQGSIKVNDLDGDLVIGGVTPNLGNTAITGLDNSDGDIEVSTAGNLVINEGVNNHGDGAARLTAGGNVQQNVDIDTDNGDIAVKAGGDLDMALGTQANSRGNGNVAYSAGGNASLRQIGTDTGSIELKAEAGDLTLHNSVATGAGNITAHAGGNLVAEDSVVVAGNGDVQLTAIGNLTQQALVQTNAGDIRIGAMGDITALDNAVVVTQGDITYLGFANVSLQQVSTEGGDISLTAGGNLVQNAVVRTAQGDILAKADGDLTTLAATTVDGAGNIDYSAGGNASLQQVSTNGGNIDLKATGNLVQNALVQTAAGNLTAHADGDLTTLAASSVLGAGNIDYSAGGNADLQQVTTGTGNIVLKATGNLNQHALVQSGAGNITAQAGGDLTMDVGTQADIAGQGDVSYSAGNNLLITQIGTGNGNATLNATSGDIQVQGNAVRNVVAKQLSATAGGNIGTNDALRTAVDTLSASAGTGSIVVDEADAVTLDNVAAANGLVALSAGDITIKQLQGESISLDSTGKVVTAAGGLVKGGSLNVAAQTGVNLHTAVDSATVSNAEGNIALAEDDGITLTRVSASNGNVSVTAGGDIGVSSVTANNGNVALTSTAGAIVTQQPTFFARLLARVAQATGITGDRVELNAASGLGNGAQGALQLHGNTVNASTTSGDVNLAQSQAVTLENVSTGNGNIAVTVADGDATLGSLSGTGSVALTTENGALVDDGNGSTRVKGDAVNLTASNGMTVQTQANSVNAQATAGNVTINEADGLDRLTVNSANGNVAVTSQTGNIGLDVVTAAGHDVSLNAAAGAIRDANNNGGNNVIAQSANLVASNGVGQAGNALEVNVQTLAASAGNGGANLASTSTSALNLASLTTAQGDIALASAGDLNVNGAVTNTGAGNIALNGVNVNQNANITTSGRGNVSVNGSGSVTMAANTTTSTDTGTVSYVGGNTVKVASIQTSNAPGGGKVVFVAPQVLDNMPGVANVRAWQVSLNAGNGSEALVKELMGDVNDSSTVDLGNRVIGGSLAESRRFMEALLQPAVVQQSGPEKLFDAGLLTTKQVTPYNGFIEGEDGVMTYNK